MVLTAVISSFVTAIVILIVRNLSSAERHLEHDIHTDFCVGDPGFARTMGCLLGPGLVDCNRIEPLTNGMRYFPRMLEDIRSAQHSITLETFIYWSGGIGRQFTDAMIERADAGVPVHLLVDWLGSWKMERSLMERVNASNIQFQYFRPPGWHNIATFNNRTHRKLLVIDGKTGYTGGAGIADSWDGDAQDEEHWRDTMYRVAGPVVGQMQAAFMDNWVQVSQKVLLGDAYLPRQEPVDGTSAQVFRSGPYEGAESARLMFLVSIASAKRTVRLGQGYFVPDHLSTKTLIAAARRGVKIDIIIQGPTDAPYTLRCTRELIGPLLRAGINVFQYQPARYHCKTMIVDEQWVSVGSTNFDTRSFRLNDEANLNVIDSDFAQQIVEEFEADKKVSRRITYEEWLNRSRRDQVLDRACSLLRAQM